MTIKHTSIGIELYADEGRYIRPKAMHDPVVESVALSPTDSPENWEDCDIEPSAEEVNENV